MAESKHYNKRDKTSNLFFKFAEYTGIALGVNSLLPESRLTAKGILLGFIFTVGVLIAALIITPEKGDRNE